MNIDKTERRHKEFLKMEKRAAELWGELRKMPLIPLKEPIQRGWDIVFDFRDDIKNRKDFPEIKEAFDACYKGGYTRNLKFVRRIRAVKDFRKLNMSVNKHFWYELPSLHSVNESKLKNLSQGAKKYFSIDPEYEKWVSFRGHRYMFIIPSYWLTVKVRPHYLTHRREKGGDLEKEYNLLRDKMTEYSYKYGIKYVYSGSSYPAYKERARTRDKIQKFKKNEIEDITNDKVPRIYDW